MKRALTSLATVFLITSPLQIPAFAMEVQNFPSVKSLSSQGAISTPEAKRKILVQEAKKTLAASIATAKSAYSLLLADAKANRDQLLLSANKDESAMALARSRYIADLAVAKNFLNDAIKQANRIYAESLANAGASISK